MLANIVRFQFRSNHSSVQKHSSIQSFFVVVVVVVVESTRRRRRLLKKCVGTREFVAIAEFGLSSVGGWYAAAAQPAGHETNSKSPAVQSSAAERGVKGKKGHRTNNCVESCGGAGLCGVLVPPTSVVCCLCTRRILSCYCCCKRNELGFSGLCCDPRDLLEAASG